AGAARGLVLFSWRAGGSASGRASTPATRPQKISTGRFCFTLTSIISSGRHDGGVRARCRVVGAHYRRQWKFDIAKTGAPICLWTIKRAKKRETWASRE